MPSIFSRLRLPLESITGTDNHNACMQGYNGICTLEKAAFAIHWIYKALPGWGALRRSNNLPERCRRGRRPSDF